MVTCRICGGILVLFCFFPTLVLIPLGVANIVSPNQRVAVIKSVYTVPADDSSSVGVAATFSYKGQNLTCYVDSASTDITTVCINARDPRRCSASCDSSVEVGIGCVVTGSIWFVFMVAGGVVFSTWPANADTHASVTSATDANVKEQRREPPMVQLDLERASMCLKLAVAAREEPPGEEPACKDAASSNDQERNLVIVINP